MNDGFSVISRRASGRAVHYGGGMGRGILSGCGGFDDDFDWDRWAADWGWTTCDVVGCADQITAKYLVEIEMDGLQGTWHATYCARCADRIESVAVVTRCK